MQISNKSRKFHDPWGHNKRNSKGMMAMSRYVAPSRLRGTHGVDKRAGHVDRCRYVESNASYTVKTKRSVESFRP